MTPACRANVTALVPGARLGVEQVEVVILTEDVPVLGLDPRQRFVELGIDVQHPSTRVLDDEADLVDREPEVDRHEHPPRPADPEERGHQPGGVVGDVRDALPHLDAQRIQLGGVRAGQLADPAVRQVTERLSWLVGLVEEARSVGVHRHRSVEKVVDGERDDHPVSIRIRRSGRYDDVGQLS